MAAGPTRRWFAWAVVLAALVHLALFAYVAAPGLAGTGDSRYYLHAAQTLRGTGHLLNPDGTAYRYWPPLFPVLLRGCGSLAGLRLLHGGCLLGSLLLWSWLGRQLLPPRRAMLLPALLALSTPWLLVSKFVWAEAGFLLLFAAYVGALLQWLRTGRRAWWWAATAVGLLLPLQRTLGLFLLAGIGGGLLLSEWRRLFEKRQLLLMLQLGLGIAGGLAWQWYALLVAGPSRYHPSRGWNQLLSSLADYGFVLGRWLLPLPTAGRALLPATVWLIGLVLLWIWLWPSLGHNSYNQSITSRSNSEVQSCAQPEHLLRRLLWSTSLLLILLVAALTVFAQSAAGTQDAERYASVLFGPVALLVLVAWPARAPHWLGWLAVAIWLGGSTLRVGHVARDLRQVPPLPPQLLALPAAHGQGVGAGGQ